MQENKGIIGLIYKIVRGLFVKRIQDVKEKDFKNDTFFKIIGMCDTGINDGSVNHDRDIYQYENRR